MSKKESDDYRNILNQIFMIPRNYKIPNQIQKKTEEIINELFINVSSNIKQYKTHHYFGEGLGAIENSTNYLDIPQEIREDTYNRKYLHEYYRTILNAGRVVKIYIINDENENDKIFNTELYEKMVSWISYLSSIAPDNCSKTLTIYILLTAKKKILPRNRKHEIDRQNANSAFTFSCKKNNEIFIYRKEEVFKVFIHESFHSFGLDFSMMDCFNANRIITNKFQGLDKDCDYRIYESYCEIWAQIMNIMVIVSKEEIYRKQPASPPLFSPDVFNKINEYLFYEKLWSIFQCSKILYHYDIKYDDLFNNKFTEYTEKNTQVFSYYILRAIGIVNFNEFIFWARKENSETMVFEKSDENIINYCNFICDLSRCKMFVEGLTIANKWLTNGKIPVDNLNILKSMRMSIS